jgi:parallel beta-helix repeat protein
MKKRIPALKGFIAKYSVYIGICIVLVFVLFGVFIYSNAGQSVIENVQVTNLTATSATVTWQTTKPTSSTTYHKKSKSLIPLLFAKKEVDDRDIDSKNEYKTHHVTIADLDINTEYSFKIQNRLSFTKPYKFTTKEVRENLETPRPVYGRVLSQNQESAKDSIVFVYIKNESKESEKVSTTLNDSQSWSADIANIASEGSFDLYDTQTQLVLEIATPNQFTKNLVFDLDKSQPVPDILLSNKEKSDTATYNQKFEIKTKASKEEGEGNEPSVNKQNAQFYLPNEIAKQHNVWRCTESSTLEYMDDMSKSWIPTTYMKWCYDSNISCSESEQVDYIPPNERGHCGEYTACRCPERQTEQETKLETQPTTTTATNPTQNTNTQIITVCPAPKQGCDFPKAEGFDPKSNGKAIQDAIDSIPGDGSSANHVINIKNGTYVRTDGQMKVRHAITTDGTNQYDKCFLYNEGKSLQLIGESKEGVVFGGEASSEATGICVHNGEVTIKNLTVQSFKDIGDSCDAKTVVAGCGRGYGLYFSGSSVIELSNTTVKNNARLGVNLSNNSTGTISDNEISGNKGIGIVLYGSSDGTISGNKISENNYQGIDLLNDSKATISDNEVSRNKGSGIALWESSEGTISGNKISENNYQGIDLLNDSKATISGNKISENNYQGIFLTNDSKATISDNEISGNKGSGITLFESSDGTIRNNIINQNKYEAIELTNCTTVSIANNTLVANGEVRTGGISMYHSCNVTAKNNIIAFNNKEGIYRDTSNTYKHTGTLTLDYNNVYQNVNGDYVGVAEGERGANSIMLDPQFIDRANNNFRLQTGSPSKQGDPSILNPDGSRSDMGAYGGPGACILDDTLPGCTNATKQVEEPESEPTPEPNVDQPEQPQTQVPEPKKENPIRAFKIEIVKLDVTDPAFLQKTKTEILELSDGTNYLNIPMNNITLLVMRLTLKSNSSNKKITLTEIGIENNNLDKVKGELGPNAKITIEQANGVFILPGVSFGIAQSNREEYIKFLNLDETQSFSPYIVYEDEKGTEYTNKLEEIIFTVVSQNSIPVKPPHSETEAKEIPEGFQVIGLFTQQEKEILASIRADIAGTNLGNATKEVIITKGNGKKLCGGGERARACTKSGIRDSKIKTIIVIDTNTINNLIPEAYRTIVYYELVHAFTKIFYYPDSNGNFQVYNELNNIMKSIGWIDPNTNKLSLEFCSNCKYPEPIVLELLKDTSESPVHEDLPTTIEAYLEYGRWEKWADDFYSSINKDPVRCSIIKNLIFSNKQEPSEFQRNCTDNEGRIFDEPLTIKNFSNQYLSDEFAYEGNKIKPIWLEDTVMEDITMPSGVLGVATSSNDLAQEFGISTEVMVSGVLEYSDYGIAPTQNQLESVMYLEEGVYDIEIDSAKYKNIVVANGDDNNQSEVFLYVDTNNNGYFDAEDYPYFAELDDIKVNKTSDLFTYSLKPGWNLFAFPFVFEGQESMKASELIKQLNSQGSHVTNISTYRNNSWLSYILRDDQVYSNDFDIIPTEAYFIKNYTTTNITFKANAYAQSMPVSIDAGWNLVNIISKDTDYSADSLLKDFQDNKIQANIVTKWQDGMYTNYIKEDEQPYGEDFELFKKSGYFVRSMNKGKFTP